MKSTGIVRKVDTLDRIVIPKELCRTLEIGLREPIEIFLEDGLIVIKKHTVAKISASNKGGIGIVRRIDSLDRIVIPKEICRVVGIVPRDSLEIFVEDDKIILSKYEPHCIFCQEVRDVISFKQKLICKNCLKELKKL